MLDFFAYRAGMVTAQDIKAILEKTGWTQSELAGRVRVTQASVSRWLKGAMIEAPNQERVKKLMASIGVEQPPEGATVPVVGKVAAGSALHFFSDGELGRVRAPENATASTVAAEIDGESLGSFFNQWIVYYDDVRDPPTPGMVGKVCICGLSDGRTLIKRLAKGSVERTWTLHSQFEPPIYDVYLDWAATVTRMEPR